MTKKHTIPNEPEEFPAGRKRPEVAPPTDPAEPKAPVEAPDNIPQEVPPDEAGKPEISPARTTGKLDNYKLDQQK